MQRHRGEDNGEVVEVMEAEQPETISDKERNKGPIIIGTQSRGGGGGGGAAKEKQVSEMDVMKERFAKLLLGEDISGRGKGIASALALSNALTNLAASVFGEQWKLEPIPQDRKDKWRREVGWLISVTDHIVELVASQQTAKNGSTIEIMVTQQRKDVMISIPALRKLDNMLLDTLDNFNAAQEYKYLSREGQDSDKGVQRDDKWWLPTIKIPPNGLSEKSRLFLQKQKEAVNQIIKECTDINARTLSEMEVPQSYMETLPKNGKSCLGESIYKNITDDVFEPQQFLSTLDVSSENKVVDLKNRIEASVVIWKRKKNNSKDGKVSVEKREVFEERAQTILLLLKQQFPGLPQSSLDTTKIQYNKDIGLAILESYSRVLKNLAITVRSRIDDVMYVDSITRTNATPITRALFGFKGWGFGQAETQVK